MWPVWFQNVQCPIQDEIGDRLRIQKEKLCKHESQDRREKPIIQKDQFQTRRIQESPPIELNRSHQTRVRDDRPDQN